MVSSIWLFQYLAIQILAIRNYIMNKTAIMNNRNATLVYEFWVNKMQVLFLWGKCLRVWLLAFMVIAYLHLERNSVTVFQCHHTILYFRHQYKNRIFLNLSIFIFWLFYDRYIMIFPCVFYLHIPNVEHIFLFLFSISIYFSVSYIFTIFAHFITMFNFSC